MKVKSIILINNKTITCLCGLRLGERKVKGIAYNKAEERLGLGMAVGILAPGEHSLGVPNW